MPTELLAWYQHLPVFALVASRVGGLIMFQPMLGALSIPGRIRAMLVLALAALVTPMVALDAAAPADFWLGALACAHELLLGLLLGLVVRLCFLGLQVGGMMIAQEAGLAYGQTIDPTTDYEQDFLSVFYVQLAGVVFLILGGHRVLVAAALDTFKTIPLLGVNLDLARAADLLLAAMTSGTELGLRIAAPIVLTMLLVNTVLGFLSRSMPQFNLMTVGFSIKTLVTLTLLAVALPAGMSAFVGALEEVTNWIGDLSAVQV